MFRTRDDRKISIIGGLLLLGLTVTAGVAVYSAMQHQIESVLGRGLGVALQGKALLIESQVEKSVADTHALALRPFLIQSIQELNAEPEDEHAMHNLMLNVNSLPDIGFYAAIVYDLQGKVLAQVGNFSNSKGQSLPLYKYSQTSLIWDQQFILRTSTDVLDSNKQRIGSITTENTLPQLTRRLSEIRSIGETGEFILCAPPAHDARDMACLISQINGIKFRYMERVVNGGISPISYAFDGKSGVIAAQDYRQVPVIEAYAPLKAIGLGMILKLDEEELFKSVKEELKKIILYIAGLIAAEILLLNWFVRKLIKSEQEAYIAKDRAEQFSIELSHKEIELRERLKEITCLYEIRRNIGLELSMDTMCQIIFKYLIPAVQYPEMATAVIELDGWRFTSGKSDPSFAHQVLSKTRIADRSDAQWRAERDPGCTCRSEISVNGKVCGQLRVFYPANKPFILLEEQRLISAIASDLESWLERKRLEQALISVAEDQAHTIGQELHDNVGQQIAAIGYQARALEKKIYSTGDKNMALVAASIASQAQISVIQIKQLAQGLLPFELEANGLIFALKTLTERVASTYDIICHLQCDKDIVINDNNLALNLYRVTQEAINNAIRHGKAQRITITLTSQNKTLSLSIYDDGKGFPGSIDTSPAAGMGLRIMQYRAKQLGAKLEFLARHGGGTEILLEKQMI